MKIRIDSRDLIVHLAFAMLFLMAIQFCAERMYADASYYLFHVINSGSFHIEHGRYVLALSQLLPLAGVKLGLSLKTILLLYSLSHVLFFYTIFLVSRYRLADRSAGVLLIFLQVLCLEMGYFTPMFELYYGTGILVLFAAILWSGKLTNKRLVLLLVLSVMILTSHPMAAILWLFTIGLHALDWDKQYLKWYGILGGLLVLVFVWKSLTASQYESFKVVAIVNTYREMPFDRRYFAEAITFLFRYYQELLFLFVVTITAFIARRDHLRLAFVCLSFAGMFLVIHGAHYGFQHSRYQEQVYFPLTWIVALPVVLCLKHKSWDRIWQTGFWTLCVILIIVKIVSIYREAPAFTQRITMMERQVAHAQSGNVTKGILGEANVTRMTSVDPNWSYAIETMLISGRQGRDSVVTLCLDTDMNFENNAAKIGEHDFLMRRWDIKPMSWLDQRYFTLAPGPYRVYHWTDLGKVLPDSLLQGIRIRVITDDLHMARGAVGTALIEVINSSALTLPADTSFRINLSYHWMLGDSLVKWDGLRTPLEVDLEGGSRYIQTLDIRAPEHTGYYLLVPDIVAEGRRWFGLDERKEVWVY